VLKEKGRARFAWRKAIHISDFPFRNRKSRASQEQKRESKQIDRRKEEKDDGE